jgi:zinc-ribbon domain
MSNDWDDDDWDEDDCEDDLKNAELQDVSDAHYVCPLCGAEVYDDANVCSACGDYIVPKMVIGSEVRPMWYIALGTIGIIAVLLVLSGAIQFLFR